MKRYLVLFITSLLIWMSTGAQPHIDVVNKALNGNSADQIVRYFDNIVDITLNNEQSTYSKVQAEMVIRNFIAKNGIKIFKVLLVGQRNETSFFIIGEASGSQKGRYKVFLFFKQKGNQSILQQAKIDQARD